MGLHFLGDFLSTFQWQGVLSLYHRLSLKKLFPLYLIGAFFNNFLPTSIGGDVYKVHRLTTYKVKISQAVSSVLISRLMGLGSLITLATFTFCWPVNYAVSGPDIKFILAMLWVIMITIFFLPQFLAGFKFLSEIHEALDSCQKDRRVFLLSIALSLAAQIMGIFFCIILARSLDLKLSSIQIAYFSSLTIIISAIPLAINGLGLREGTYVWLFSKVGLSKETALSFSLLILLFIIIRSTIGGMCYAFGQDKA
jgi:uncharacterized membrane protein YbhN (UPF0104 family)